MIDLLGFLSVFALFGVLAYFAIKFFNKASEKELKEWENKLFPKFENTFGKTPSKYSREDKHEVLDSILKELRNEIFTSRVKPDRYVVKGKDDGGRNYLAAVVRSVNHQTGGRRTYYILYALNTENEDIESKYDKKIGDWCIFYKEILNIKEEPVLNELDFDKLVSRVN